MGTAARGSLKLKRCVVCGAFTAMSAAETVGGEGLALPAAGPRGHAAVLIHALGGPSLPPNVLIGPELYDLRVPIRSILNSAKHILSCIVLARGWWWSCLLAGADGLSDAVLDFAQHALAAYSNTAIVLGGRFLMLHLSMATTMLIRVVRVGSIGHSYEGRI